MKRKKEENNIDVSSEIIDWASIAIFKNAYNIFQERGYNSKLLAAAFRCDLHWSEIVGGDVIISMPYDWWNKFNNSGINVENKINIPVDEKIISTLKENFEDFNKAYHENGMGINDFESFGPTKHTMRNFLLGYDEFANIVRDRMINK